MKSHIRKQSLRKLLSGYYVRIFVLHHGPLCAPKYNFPDSTKRGLANCFLKSKLYVCEMTSQIRKKFLRKFLSRFELMKIPFQHSPQCDPKKPFSVSSKTVLMDCSTKHKCNSKDEFTHHQEICKKLSSFHLWILSLSP